MKHTLNILIFLFTTTLFAQYPDTIYGTAETRKMAQEITSVYDAKLGLTGTQWPIFENKIRDYLELSQKIKNTKEGAAELDALTELAVKESLDMQDILTRIQYNLYKKIRQDIQPIKVANPNEVSNK